MEYLNLHDFSINIEFYIKSYFNCERNGFLKGYKKARYLPFGSIINADYIDKNPIFVMFTVLCIVGNKRRIKGSKPICEFLDKYEKYKNYSGDVLYKENKQLFKDATEEFIKIIRRKV